jgi:hypothetical protein
LKQFLRQLRNIVVVGGRLKVCLHKKLVVVVNRYLHVCAAVINKALLGKCINRTIDHTVDHLHRVDGGNP